jgi:SAM-dependent methyltransferase
LAHDYHILKHWNDWLSQQFLGAELLQAEKQALETLLARHFGKHVLLIGVDQQLGLLEATHLMQRTLFTPLLAQHSGVRCIEGSLRELPILSGSVDLVLLPHTLEFVDNPQQLLAESCRIIKPEGLIAVVGFNPYSWWGLTRMINRQREMPWKANIIFAHQIKNWLGLADFEMEEHQSVLFRPPASRVVTYKRLSFLERVGKRCLPMSGGVYLLTARAKVTPLTPIRLKWQQRLTGIRIPTTLPGSIARQVD